MKSVIDESFLQYSTIFMDMPMIRCLFSSDFFPVLQVRGLELRDEHRLVHLASIVRRCLFVRISCELCCRLTVCLKNRQKELIQVKIVDLKLGAELCSIEKIDEWTEEVLVDVNRGKTGDHGNLEMNEKEKRNLQYKLKRRRTGRLNEAFEGKWT